MARFVLQRSEHKEILRKKAAELITESQSLKMQHALGMNSRKTYKRAGVKWYRPSRNWYYAAGNDQEWEDLVSKGIAEKRDHELLGGRSYQVNKEGLSVLSALLDIYIYSRNSDCEEWAKHDIIEVLIEHATHTGYGCWLPLSAEEIAIRARLPMPVTLKALRILREEGISAHTYTGQRTEDGVRCIHGNEITEKGIEENRELYERKMREDRDRMKEILREAAERNQ